MLVHSLKWGSCCLFESLVEHEVDKSNVDDIYTMGNAKTSNKKLVKFYFRNYFECWDGTNPIEMDNMYSRVSAALGLHYILLIGRDSYDRNISLNPFKIISEIKFNKKDKRTNEDLQNRHIKLQIEQHEPHFSECFLFDVFASPIV
jgi:hypothetical protein